MLDENKISEIIKAALGENIDYADLFISKKATRTLYADNHKLEKIYGGFDEGAGIRVIKGKYTGYLYTNDVSFPSLIRLAQEAKAAANGVGDGQVVSFSLKEFSSYPAGSSLQAYGELLKAANSYAWSCSTKVKQVSLSLADVKNSVIFANSLGMLYFDDRYRRRFAVQILGADGKNIQSASETLGDTVSGDIWQEDALFPLIDKAVMRAIYLLDAKPSPSGPMPVILASEAGGTMVHEACGHGLEGDLVQKGLSVYEGRIGEMVASPLVTVVDDATLSGHYGSYAMDDEGHLGRRNILIENGKLLGFLYDYYTAKQEETDSTGNGRRESYRYLPQTRMSNTIIVPGNTNPADILADTPKGLYVTKIGGGQVNSITGDFLFEVGEAYLIENGRLGHMVKNATLNGNGPKALASVDAVGSDMGYAIGTCGKGGQGVSVGDGQPTLRLPEMIVGGRK